jgi:poly-gamma-glutamate synthesis protein (capsule biosynthesis protein)
MQIRGMAIRGVLALLAVTTLALSAGCANPSDPFAAVAPAVSVPEVPETRISAGLGPECPTAQCFTLMVNGDMLFHKGLWIPAALNPAVNGQNFDFMPLLEGQQRYINQSDLALCHMETPFAPSGGPYAGYPLFATPPELATTIKQLGYDGCTQASNHSVDQGTAGLNRTIDVFDQLGIPHTGTYKTEEDSKKIFMLETGGVNVAFIQYTFSLNGLRAEYDWQVNYPLDADRMIAQAQQARDEGADLVVGVVHAGTEYSSYPDAQQLNVSRALVDSGLIDFVYNHHTHSVQPIELYNSTWIAYGLGNGISESSSEYPVNNEFLTVRVQFAKQNDGTWRTTDLAWMAATNKQNGQYKWCSVASDAPQGICQSEAFDAGVQERTRKTVNAMGADAAGAHEWLITEDALLAQ